MNLENVHVVINKHPDGHAMTIHLPTNAAAELQTYPPDGQQGGWACLRCTRLTDQQLVTIAIEIDNYLEVIDDPDGVK